MFFRRASMMGAMLPLTSMRNTTSATPLVLARVCGAAAGAAGSDCPADSAATGSATGAGTAAGGAAEGVANVGSPDGVSTANGEVVAVSSVAIYRSAEGRLLEVAPGIVGICRLQSTRGVRRAGSSAAGLDYLPAAPVRNRHLWRPRYLSCRQGFQAIANPAADTTRRCAAVL